MGISGADLKVVAAGGDGPLYLATFGVVARLAQSDGRRSSHVIRGTLVLDALIDAGSFPLSPSSYFNLVQVWLD